MLAVGTSLALVPRKGQRRIRKTTRFAAFMRYRPEATVEVLLMFSKELGAMEPGSLIPPGVHTLADVIHYGRKKGVCPYFTVRRMVCHALAGH